MSKTETSDNPNPRRKWRRWIVPACFLSILVWLNGPGIRWLGPELTRHFLSKSGMDVSFQLEGSLTGGLLVNDLRFESDQSLALLTVDRVAPDYSLMRLLKGELDGIEIVGLHAHLRLGLENDKPEEQKDPLDLAQLVKTLRSVRNHVITLETRLDDISMDVTRDGKPVISLASSRIRHKAGQADVDLEIGIITDATGHQWPARESSIIWNDDELMIDQLDPLPNLSVRGLSVQLPENGVPSAEAELRLDDAVFLVNASPGFSSIQVNLREGALVSEKVAKRFGVKLPASGELSSLSASVDNLLPDPKAATGSAQVLLEHLSYEDWKIPELSLDATLESARATVAARAAALDTEVSLDAGVPVTRTDGAFQLGDADGRFIVADIAKLVASLAGRLESIDPEAPVPESSIDGAFKIGFANNQVRSADIDLALKPVEPEVASPLSASAKWLPGKPVSARVALDGLTADAEYDLERQTYKGNVDFKEFNSSRIHAWLDVVRAGTGGAVSLTGKWSGDGAVKENVHQGTLGLADADFIREEVPTIHAEGEIAYDWPKGFTTKGIQIKAADQAVAVDLSLDEGFLQMSNLLWRDGDKEMATGSAKLPVPDDVSKWRDMLAHDDRPLAVSINSKFLPLASLKDWLPTAEKLDPRSTGQVSLQVSGTYARPVMDASIDVRELRFPEQPKLPPVDLALKFSAREEQITIHGNVLTPDFPPAVLTASMPFRPGEWAEKPELLMGENISARLDLPRIDLSRFTTLVPGAKKLSGAITGNLEIAGEIGKPDAKGKVYLINGALVMNGPDIPPVTGLAASVGFSLDEITLDSLEANVAGGTLGASGSLSLENGKPGAIDFRVKGDHLPLKRDESLIVRANADLSLSGTWEQAALKGRVGVVDSIFFKDIELLPIGSPFTGPSAASLPKIDAPSRPEESVPEPFRNWTLDVVVKTEKENPFLIRGNLATGKVTADLRIGGTFGKPAPDGEVRISDFRASLPFSTLDVKTGILRFTPGNGFDPALEIRGTSEPRPYRVGVFVYGQASDPQLVLTSSPPLPENEIMTLLATGTTTSGLEDPQTASTRALQLFAEEIRRGRFAVGKQLRPLLGLLDRVDFTVAEADPYSSGSYSTATLRITDNWFLSAGMGGEGDSRVLGIWRLRFY